MSIDAFSLDTRTDPSALGTGKRTAMDRVRRPLLHPGLRYELPQTREYIESGDGYFEMFRTWPGSWSATVKDLVCGPDKAVSVIDFQVEDKTMTGISFFEVASDLIWRVTDYWPSPYDPPPRETPHMKRRDP